MAGDITFSGLGSGLDTSSIISKLVSAVRVPETRLKQQQADYTTQTTTLQQISSALTDLKTAAANIDTRDELLAHTASASDTSILDVAAGGAASPGTFKLRVDQLATAQRNYSKTADSATAPAGLGTGTLKVGVGGKSATLTVDATTTLSSLASDINSRGLAVRASVINTTAGARLQVVGLETGAANAITFAQTGSLALGFTDNGNQIADAKDAIIHIDGFQANRPSNTLSDVIPGLTIKLKDAQPAKDVTVTVQGDDAGVQRKVQSFVDAYNRVQKLINDQFSFSGAVDTSKLMGDSTLESLQRELHSVVASKVSGTSDADATTGTVLLSQVGITTNADVSLKIDSTKFAAALDQDANTVANLFVQNGTVSGVAVGMQTLVDHYTKSVTGRLNTRINSITSMSKDIDKQVATIEQQAATYQDQLSKQFTQLESLMQSMQSQSSYLTSYLK